MWRRLKPLLKPESVAVRVIPFTAVMAAGTVIASWATSNFVTNLSNFLDCLLILLIPWTAINLTDFFAVRHGDYDVASFFDPDGGPYGKFAWRGLVAWLPASPRSCPSSTSRTTPARWSPASAAPTSPGSSAGSSPAASTCT